MRWWSSRSAFDRTYEGLKRHGGHLPGRLEDPFDRTYEGLKPRRGKRSRPGEPRPLTVPMRV